MVVNKILRNIDEIKVSLSNVVIPKYYDENNIQFRIGPEPPYVDPRHQILVDNVEIWNGVDGDFTHRLDYDLSEDAVVFDVGGYMGDWAASIYARHTCNIYIFEPVSSLHKRMVNRFKGNGKFKLFNIGLGKKTRDEYVATIGDESSFYLESSSSEIARVVNVSEFIEAHGIKEIDLFKLNIEGGEYEVIPRLIESGDINKVKNLQIQFHYWIENSDKMITKIRQKLARTHTQTYSYDYVWENWERND